MNRPLALLAAGACLWGTPKIADACSAPACWPGGFLPADDAQVPANLPGIVWQPVIETGTPGAPSNVVLATASEPEQPLPFTAMPLGYGGNYVLVPDAPLEEGTTYVLRDESTCFDGSGPSVTFTTTGDTMFPTALGELATTYGRGTLEVATIAGSCSSDVDAAYVDLALTFDSSVMPWRDALVFETWVDGNLWRTSSSINVRVGPGRSWTGRGTDRIYAVCGTTDPYADDGVAAGTHEVVMRASLPGSDVELASQTVTIELWCDGDEHPQCHGPCDETEIDDGGCNTGRGGSAWAVLLLGAMLMLRKTRRR